MISDAEKVRFLDNMISIIRASDPNHRNAQILSAIRDDYQTDNDIRAMRPWFEAQIALGRTVSDLMTETGAERHRILFALNTLGLAAPGMQA